MSKTKRNGKWESTGYVKESGLPPEHTVKYKHSKETGICGMWSSLSMGPRSHTKRRAVVGSEGSKTGRGGS